MGSAGLIEPSVTATNNGSSSDSASGSAAISAWSKAQSLLTGTISVSEIKKRRGLPSLLLVLGTISTMTAGLPMASLARRTTVDPLGIFNRRPPGLPEPISESTQPA